MATVTRAVFRFPESGAGSILASVMSHPFFCIDITFDLMQAVPQIGFSLLSKTTLLLKGAGNPAPFFCS